MYQLQWINPREEAIQFWSPIACSMLLAVLLRRRFKLLLFNTAKDPVFGMLVFVAISIAVPAIIAETYIETATSRLEKLTNDREASEPQYKYYRLYKTAITHKNFRTSLVNKVTGKRNQTFTMNLYVAAPIYAAKGIHAIESRATETELSAARSDKEALIVIDGVVVDKLSYDAFNDSAIYSIKKFTPKEAVDLYGEQAAKGAFLIYSKSYINELSQGGELNTKGWACFKYSRSISNNLSAAAKWKAASDFKTESISAFENTDFNSCVYLKNIGNNALRQQYLSTIQRDEFNGERKALILEPVFTPFDQRNGDKTGWIFLSMLIGMSAVALRIYFIPLKTNTLPKSKFGSSLSMAGFEEFIQLLRLKNYLVTSVLITINVFVFIVMVTSGLGFFSFSAYNLLNWGAGFKPYMLQGEWWRLLTCMFLHGGIVHLLSNMVALAFAGAILEPVLGPWQYLLFYLFTGLVASCASFWWHDRSVTIGASGAIFGLYGIFLALLVRKTFPATINKAFLTSTLFFIGINLALGLSGQTDNAAHIGGLLGGFVCGLLIADIIKYKLNHLPETVE